MAFIAKIMVGFAPVKFIAMPIGTKTRSTLIQLDIIMSLEVSQNRVRTGFLGGLAVPTTDPCPSASGGGAGGGTTGDMLSAALLDVAFDGPASLFSLVSELLGETSLEVFAAVEAFLLGVLSPRVRVCWRPGLLVSGEGPCAFVRAHDCTRSTIESESGAVFFISVRWQGREKVC